MATLQYDIAISEGRMKRVLRGVESELRAHERKVNAIGRSARRASRPDGLSRGFKQIGQVAAREEVKRHKLTLRNRDREQRRALRGIGEIGRAARQIEARRHREALRNSVSERRAATRARERFGRGAASSLGRGVGRVATLGGSALGVAGLGVGFATVNAVRNEAQIIAGASKLANQAGTPEIKGQLAKEARGVRGFTGGEVLGGLEAFVDITGDLGAARAIMGDLSTLALATGTNLEDLAAAAGNAFIPLADKIKEPKKRLEELNKVMAVVAAQGAVGAVEIKDLATEMAGLAATANRFTGDPTKNLAVMGALAQAARQRGGAGSAAEAVTSVQRFSSDVIKKNKLLGKLGVDVFADKERTQLKGPQQIITDVLKATGGDLSKLTPIFGERSIRAVQGFSPLYSEAERRKKGTGGAAVEAEFARLLKNQLSPEEQKRRAESRLADPDLKFQEAMKEFNFALGSELLPEVTKLIPEFTKLVPAIADLAKGAIEVGKWFLSNPFVGLGAIIAGSVALDLAKAGIGSVISSGLSAILGRFAGARAAGAAASGLASLSGAGASAGAAGAGAAAAGAGRGFLAASVLGTSIGAGGALAAGGGAAVGLGAAYLSNEHLKKATGGAGIGSFLSDLMDTGSFSGAFNRIDERQNEQAKAEAKQREDSASGGSGSIAGLDLSNAQQSADGTAEALNRTNTALDTFGEKLSSLNVPEVPNPKRRLPLAAR